MLETSLSRLSLGELNSIVEVFWPGWICNTAEMLGISSGQAFDLRLADPDDDRPWDLSIASKRHKVWWTIVELDPWLVVGSPACAPSSSLHYLDAKWEDPVKRAESIWRGIVHLAFCFAIYRERANKGRYFLREHPWAAWSLRLDFVRAFPKREDVFLGRGDQCPFGQEAMDWYGEGYVLKPTGWLSNSLPIVSKVGVRCPNHYLEPGMPGRHGHVQLLNGKAKACQAYPPRLEPAIIDGLVEQFTSDRILNPVSLGLWNLRKICVNNFPRPLGTKERTCLPKRAKTSS